MQTRPRASRPPALDLLLLALLPLLIQAPGLLGWIDSDPLLRLSVLAIPGHPGWLPGFPGWIDPNVGTTTQTLGHLAASDLLAGRMPWWNPYSGIGVPLAAEMQPAALFLPFVLLLRLAHGVLWLRAAMGAVAGLATYELLRALGMRRAACLAGAVLFALNGTAAWLPHGPDRAAAFLPLILLGIERAGATAAAGRPLGWLWLAAGLAWSVAAGFPETAYLDGLLAALWALWRLLSAPWPVRRRLAGKLLAGLAVALLVTAPAWWPFLELLRLGDAGGHAAGFADLGLPAPAWPMLLLPYVYGPIFAFGGSGPGGPTEGAWGTIGGYTGAAAVVLALVRLCGGGAGDGGLRWLLAAWVALCLAKMAALPGVIAAVNLLPGMPLVAFFRYAEPSCELALALLAAGAIDAFAAGRLSPRRVVAAILLAAGLLAAALWRAWGTLARLGAEPGAVPFAIGAALWCGLVIAAAGCLLRARPRHGRVAALALLACLDAVAMFALPFASATRGGRIDRAPLDFLRAHLGLQRFFALAAIPANYGALYGVAQLNDDMLPMPASWAAHIRAALDPLATPTWFSGSIGYRPRGPDPRAMLLTHLAAYRALGVRYVVTMRGADSLSGGRATVPGPWTPRHPWALPPGAALAGTLPPGFAAGPVDALAVEVGTYAGRADGTLMATLCAGAVCAHGQAALRGAPDNTPLDIALSPPLAVPAGATLRFTLTHQGGSASVAIWEAAGGPALTLSWPRPGVDLPRVFRDPHVDIFELPGAAPYFSADPPCALAPAGRLAVAADCPAPATLTRRELAFPGWRAWRDGQPVALAAEGIVQTVALPAGRSVLRFAYAPPRIGWTYVMALLGLLWVAAACLGWRRAAGAARLAARHWPLGPVASDRLLLLGLPLLLWLPALAGLIDTSPALLLTALHTGGQPGLIGGQPGWLDPNVGYTTEALGHLAAQDWLAGRVPWWNPYSGVGVPLTAEMQPAALFLPFVLLLHWPNGLVLLRLAMQVVAGLGTYELLRTMGLRRAACLAGAILFAFNGTAAWLPHGPDRAAAFLPLVLLGVERARQHAADRRGLGWLWLAVGLAWSLYAGFPETAFIDALFAAVWAGWRLAWPIGARPWAERRLLLAKLAAGAAVGVLLAAPILWPFLEYLRLGYLGDHGPGFGHTALPANAFPLFLVPYLYGNIASYGQAGPGSATFGTWGAIGGYLGAAAMVPALLGLLAGRRGLRWALAAWIAACLARTAALPGITALFNAVPMIAASAFFRYAEPGWELAAIVLAALGIDAWARGWVRRWHVVAVAAVAAALLAAALWVAWPTLTVLLPMRHFLWRAGPALAWCVGVMAALLLLAAGRFAPGRARLLVGIVCLDAALMFGVPLLQATRGMRPDLAAVTFLRDHLGLRRFYALGAIPPNYGAYFGVASIDETMVPLPRAWADQVTAKLDPAADPVTFDGLARGASAPGAALRARLGAYAALGVRYVVTPASDDPLEDAADSAPGAGGMAVWRLPPGATLAGTLPAGFATAGRQLAGMAVTIGTYGGQADGRLELSVCDAAACASGGADLGGAADNAPLRVELQPRLTAAGAPLSFTIRHAGGHRPVAVWLVGGSAARLGGSGPTGGPLLRLIYSDAVPSTPVAYRDAHVVIRELPGAAPYFSAGPTCRLTALGRRHVLAECAAPDRLVRRELAFPGWRASVNGHRTRLGRDGLFQTIVLPAGRADIRFRYAPPFIGLAWAAAALGVLWMLAALAVARRRIQVPSGAFGNAVVAAASVLPRGPAADRLLIVLLPALLWLPALLGVLDSSPMLRLTALGIGGYAGWLPGQPGWLDVNFGFTTEALGHLAAQDWLAGRVPWWNPYSGAGVPLAAEMQPAALFLPFILLLHWTKGLVLLRLAMQVVAGLGSYELLRALRLRRLACLIGALLFTFNGTAAWMAHGPDRVAAFLPLILLGIEHARAAAAERRGLGWAWIAVGLAVSLYAGFPESAFLNGLFAALWAAWRLVRPGVRARAVRLRLLGKLAAGAGAGLLLAAPAVWPFAHYLGLADVANHSGALAHAALPTNGFPLFLIPYLYGNIASYGGAATGPTWATWGVIGGYAGAALTALALAGVLAGGGGLRWVLAGWILACLAKSADLPGVTAALNAIPGVTRTMFFRYAEPGWLLAAVVLAAMAVDAWLAGTMRRRAVLLAAVVGAAAVAGALHLAWPTIAVLSPVPGFRAFAWKAATWCVLVMAGVFLLLAGRPMRWRAAALLGLAGLDAMLMFGLPQLDAGRGGRLDEAPVAFLRAHLGLQRFYALGAIQPNYGAYFGLASIDETMIPLPATWSDYVHTRLDPYATPVAFDGLPRPGRPAAEQPRALLRTHLDAYRALGVRYVVGPAADDPLEDAADSAPGASGSAALPLQPGAMLSGTLPPGFATAGRWLAGMALTVGTDAGQADGRLELSVCAAGACASGSGDVVGAADNAPLRVALQPRLTIAAGAPLSFTIRHAGGHRPVAVWLVGGSAARLGSGSGSGSGAAGGPLLRLIYGDDAPSSRVVFRDAHVLIRELLGASPYFSAGPTCRLTALGRRHVLAECAAPDRLVRRELAFPGWRASVDGYGASLGRDGLFQTIALPAGRADIRFRYAPPFIGLAWAAAALGVLWMLAAALAALVVREDRQCS